jgi:hypothetical protein
VPNLYPAQGFQRVRAGESRRLWTPDARLAGHAIFELATLIGRLHQDDLVFALSACGGIFTWNRFRLTAGHAFERAPLKALGTIRCTV